MMITFQFPCMNTIIIMCITKLRKESMKRSDKRFEILFLFLHKCSKSSVIGNKIIMEFGDMGKSELQNEIALAAAFDSVIVGKIL
ncbi:hypothetical protein C0J52_03678 [Blattella germanica]|nr:hypothetical protein C0J52_03678 [Blattella germanica]